jgi:hypothetical protein
MSRFVFRGNLGMDHFNIELRYGAVKDIFSLIRAFKFNNSQTHNLTQSVVDFQRRKSVQNTTSMIWAIKVVQYVAMAAFGKVKIGLGP